MTEWNNVLVTRFIKRRKFFRKMKGSIDGISHIGTKPGRIKKGAEERVSLLFRTKRVTNNFDIYIHSFI